MLDAERLPTGPQLVPPGQVKEGNPAELSTEVNGLQRMEAVEASAGSPELAAIFTKGEHFPFGALLVDDSGRLLSANRAAARLLGHDALTRRSHRPTCCDLLGCGGEGSPLGECLTRRALAAEGTLPEIRIDVGGHAGRAVWVTATPAGGGAIIGLRPGSRRDRRRRTEPRWDATRDLRIVTLGQTRVFIGEAEVEGGWLEHRTGQLFKLLVTERRRPVHAEQIAGALWPAGGRESLGNVRNCVHALRDQLEPRREKHRSSSFVVAGNGGYRLDTTRVWVDADEFEERAREGLSAFRRGDARGALRSFSAALRLYGGDFLGDDPYAEWAFAERDRLRDLAAESLRGISDIHLASGELDLAAEQLQRLAGVEPFDVDVQRKLIGLHLATGRRSQAVRRYDRLRRQMLQAFGEELSFDLSDVARETSVRVVNRRGAPDTAGG
jgi:DNA-binding SARP family transcriptional activator